MKITDLRCIHIPSLRALLLRIDTDEGIYGLSQVEMSKHAYMAPHILYYKPFIVGLDPRDVEGVMRRIRRLGGFKPWGAAVSSIEIALWDIAGKAAGVPVYRLLGGKVRDSVRPYMGGPPPFLPPQAYWKGGDRPEDYYEMARARKESGRGMTIMKVAATFHDTRWRSVPEHHYGISYSQPRLTQFLEFAPEALAQHSGMVTPRGLERAVECMTAVREALGDDMEMAIDCGPGWKVPGAIAFARRVEHLRPLWLEDLVTGDYTPYVSAELYREVKAKSPVMIHTGEQIYLRQNFMELIEGQAVDVIGPDPMDIGGLAELKWVAEYADLHGILIAPHGIGDGPIGLAALIQVCATLPDNFIAFELPAVLPEWKGLITGVVHEDMIQDGLIQVPDVPGLGIDLVEDEIRRVLGRDDTYLTDVKPVYA
ncbi:MAG: mandelate racemase/muconate lactonizing enzyme family protein [Anaerolineae bacterium]